MSDPLIISVDAIVDTARFRNEKKYGNIETLAHSIQSVGLIQPIVLSQTGDTYTLVAGGRRLRALKHLGVKQLFHGITLRPGTYGFIFESEVPADARLEAELDENLHRLDMDWIDSCLMIAEIHKAKREASGGKWGQRQTAELLGPGYSKSSVNYALKVAKALREGDKEVLAAGTLMDALNILLKRVSDKGVAEMQKRTSSNLPVVAPGSNLASLLDTFTIPSGAMAPVPSPKPGALGSALNLLATATPGVATAIKPLPATPAPKGPPVVIPLSQMFICGDAITNRHATNNDVMEKLFAAGVQYHHIVTDIPYGIDMDNLNSKDIASVEAEHNVDDNVALMPEFIRLAYKLIRPGGFCVFFYDLDHHEKLKTWAQDAGFKVQRWPFVACKTSACQNNAAQYNLTKNHEVAMFLRKDASAVLRHDPKFALNNSSWKAYDFAAERMLYGNPFAKPFELWKDIYDMISFPGQSVLDPYAGEMSACRAAANCGLIPNGIEISEQHYNRGLAHMRNVYSVIQPDNVTFQ